MEGDLLDGVVSCMILLVDFLCRFGFGLAAGLSVTPSRLVPSGFFRINLFVIMGVAFFATLLATSGVSALVAWLTGGASFVAWIGSAAWLARRDRPGMTACVLSGVLLAVAVGVIGSLGTPAGTEVSIGTSVWPFLSALLSGLVVGLTVHAMLLGHWYLNAPGMEISVLRRMIDFALFGWAAQFVCVVIEMEPQFESIAVADRAILAIVSLRFLAGLIGLPVLLWMSRKTLDIPNTQSATGILYVACLAAITGEIAGQLMHSL